MTNLPNSDHLVGGSTTEAQFQAALLDLYNLISEIPHVQAPEALGIVLGQVTPAKGFLKLDTENTAPADDLDNIVATGLGEKIIFVQSTSDARVITLKHESSGSGKLSMLQGADLDLEDPKQIVAFRYDNATSTWYEIYNNFQLFTPTSTLKAAARLSMGIQEVATKAIGTSSGQVPTADLLGGLAFLNSITTTQLSDGAVNGAKILDDAITLAKLAGQTAGSILYWDSSGNPQVLAPGTDGEVLITKGAGNAPEWGAGGNVYGMEVITESGTWTKPTGVNHIRVTVVGGGGGGGVYPSSTLYGGNGGTTSFGTHAAASGGYGGREWDYESAPGVGTAGDILLEGSPSGIGHREQGSSSSQITGMGAGMGAPSPLGGGGGRGYFAPNANSQAAGEDANSYGAGGGGGLYYTNAGAGGASGGMAIAHVDVTSITSVTVTIGARGTGKTFTGPIRGGHGEQGVCIVEYMG
jgi:hypothetical protein